MDDAVNINEVTRENTNLYCVDVLGVNRTSGNNAPVVSVENSQTTAPDNDAVVMVDLYSGSCPDQDDFAVRTMRDASDTLVNDVSFVFVMP